MAYGKDQDNATIYGCMDPEANNYNPAATVDDGKCEYGGDDRDSSTTTTTTTTETTDTTNGKTTSTIKTTDPKNGKTTSTIKTTDPKTDKTTSTIKTADTKNGKTTTTIKTADTKTGKTIFTTKTADTKTGKTIFTTKTTDTKTGKTIFTGIEKEKDTKEDPKFGSETTLVGEVGMIATLEDGWYFASPQMEYLLPDLNNPYVGLYHLMRDGTYMVGEGVLNASHEINPNGIIIQYFQSTTDSFVDPDPEEDDGIENPIAGEMPVVDYETIQEVREIVSDLFYKLWFVEYTLTDEQILSMQTTIRDGKKQTGRAESEPLVFYKKDRNTLENRQDLQGDEFESICQDIFDNTIIDMEGMFDIYEPPEEPTNSPEDNIEPNTYWNLKKYIMQYTNGQTSYDVVIAEELIKYHDDLLPPDSDNTDTQENF